MSSSLSCFDTLLLLSPLQVIWPWVQCRRPSGRSSRFRPRLRLWPSPCRGPSRWLRSSPVVSRSSGAGPTFSLPLNSNGRPWRPTCQPRPLAWGGTPYQLPCSKAWYPLPPCAPKPATYQPPPPPSPAPSTRLTPPCCRGSWAWGRTASAWTRMQAKARLRQEWEQQVWGTAWRRQRWAGVGPQASWVYRTLWSAVSCCRLQLLPPRKRKGAVVTLISLGWPWAQEHPHHRRLNLVSLLNYCPHV